MGRAMTPSAASLAHPASLPSLLAMSEHHDATRAFTITSQDLAVFNPSHAWISTWLVIETLAVFLGLATAAVWLSARDHGLAWVAVVLQGVWFKRLYGVGHEA